ncbi:hypothetical protein [Maridesulfovibrio ferrireducens]|uniref:Uncharacterized protein n=1 Tax=Maridesulfovibrio ferrireducens TaxID=246191 RepID=A0A1G9BXQ3_9BACT|nr:hypothetical protein [Maridesulfovibrio ferrireducens]MBI9111263.1 hypothetical protein [Maridesulfovibrio ferrireducens]SDK44229.1 hypothetical protein SAMN05660337_0461 [Maridesulfovibrio ferrireducens]
MKKTGRLKRVTLENDFGGPISFTGKLENEAMNYCERSGELVSEKIYMSEKGRTGYSVATRKDEAREKRAYLMEDQGETCLVSNGSILLGMDTDNLITFFAKVLDEQATEKSADELEYIRKQLEVVNG